MTYTHTYATLEVPKAVFDCMLKKMRGTTYIDQIGTDINGNATLIDMHGNALVPLPRRKKRRHTIVYRHWTPPKWWNK